MRGLICPSYRLCYFFPWVSCVNLVSKWQVSAISLSDLIGRFQFGFVAHSQIPLQASLIWHYVLSLTSSKAAGSAHYYSHRMYKEDELIFDIPAPGLSGLIFRQDFF